MRTYIHAHTGDVVGLDGDVDILPGGRYKKTVSISANTVIIMEA